MPNRFALLLLLLLLLLLGVFQFCSCDRVLKSIYDTPVHKEGGGFLVKRSVGSGQQIDQIADPFLLVDHFGPVEYETGKAIGAPNHPHAGFQAISYLMHGTWNHEDNLGNKHVLNKGDVQVMNCGKGIIHHEMPAENVVVEGFQIWLNLPSSMKRTKAFHNVYRSSSIPVHSLPPGCIVHVIVGSCANTTSPVTTATPVTILDVTVSSEHGTEIPISDENEIVMVYMMQEHAFFTNSSSLVSSGKTAVFEGRGPLWVHTSSEATARFLLLTGVPLREKVIKHGPFVAASRQELEQIFASLQDGTFAEDSGTKNPKQEL